MQGEVLKTSIHERGGNRIIQRHGRHAISTQAVTQAACPVGTHSSPRGRTLHAPGLMH